jgi:16S rRNA U516 pseudouridylate synthase RsuA-like enzyme
MERLDKLVSGTGRWSRREAKQLARAGRILVNGAPAAADEKFDRAAVIEVTDNSFPAGNIPTL